MHVVYFWFRLLKQGEQKLLDKELARALFAYQCSHWCGVLRRLCEETRAHCRQQGTPLPDWCEILEKDRLGWLLGKAPQAAEAVAGSVG